MNKKIALGLAIGIGVLVALVLLVMLSNRPQSLPKEPPTRPSPTRYIFPTVTENVAPSVPKGDTITVSGISVHNVYNDAVNVNSEGDVQFSQEPSYHLVYLPQLEQFLISVRKSPFGKVRLLAEQELLTKLGVSKDVACQLNVSITTPQFANPAESGRTYRLSFCQ